MKYYYFIDETGDHSLGFIDKNFPIFLLCGILLSEKSYRDAIDQINKLKLSFFGSTEVILHSRDIRKCNGAFQKLFDLGLKERFYTEINAIMGNLDYKILASSIDKEAFIKRYGKGSRNPYLISTSFVMERLIFLTDQYSSVDEIEVFIECRGKKEDRQLLEYLNNIRDKGTYYVKPERFKAKISRIHFNQKNQNDVGLQIADLIAYPLARYLLNPLMINPAFEIIKDKIYTKKDGQFMGWGIKKFP